MRTAFAPGLRPPVESANLLYNCLAIPAVLRRANIGRRLRTIRGCSLLCTGSGTGKKAGRSAAQTGHGLKK